MRARKSKLRADGCAALPFGLRPPKTLASTVRRGAFRVTRQCATRRQPIPVPDKNVLSWPNFAVSILGGVAAAVIFAVVARGGLGGLLWRILRPCRS